MPTGPLWPHVQLGGWEPAGEPAGRSAAPGQAVWAPGLSAGRVSYQLLSVMCLTLWVTLQGGTCPPFPLLH